MPEEARRGVLQPMRRRRHAAAVSCQRRTAPAKAGHGPCRQQLVRRRQLPCARAQFSSGQLGERRTSGRRGCARMRSGRGAGGRCRQAAAAAPSTSRLPSAHRAGEQAVSAAAAAARPARAYPERVVGSHGADRAAERRKRVLSHALARRPSTLAIGAWKRQMASVASAAAVACRPTGRPASQPDGRPAGGCHRLATLDWLRLACWAAFATSLTAARSSAAGCGRRSTRWQRPPSGTCWSRPARSPAALAADTAAWRRRRRASRRPAARRST